MGFHFRLRKPAPTSPINCLAVDRPHRKQLQPAADAMGCLPPRCVEGVLGVPHTRPRCALLNAARSALMFRDESVHFRFEQC
jgi:hypothetical protein